MKRFVFLILLFSSLNLAQKYYIVIISGWNLNEESFPGQDRFWNDPAVLDKYFYSQQLEQNSPIKYLAFLYGDGNDPEDVSSRYLDPERYMTTHPSSLQAFNAVFAYLDENVQYNDVLILYINGHGHAAGTSGNIAFADLSEISDEDFANTIKSVQCKKRVIIVETCKSGAFKDEFGGDRNSIFLSASDYDEDSPPANDAYPDGNDEFENEIENYRKSYHHEYDYHLLNALLQKTIGYDNNIESDLDNNEQISVFEMFDWVINCNLPEVLTPQSYWYNNLGSLTYFNANEDKNWENTLVLSNNIVDPAYLVWGENQDLTGITKYKIYRRYQNADNPLKVLKFGLEQLLPLISNSPIILVIRVVILINLLIR